VGLNRGHQLLGRESVDFTCGTNTALNDRVPQIACSQAWSIDAIEWRHARSERRGRITTCA
jgi:hypothetical protein